MLHSTLSFIKDLLNENFRLEFPDLSNVVEVSNIINSDGSSPKDIEAKIVCFLVGIENETALKNNVSRSQSSGSGSFEMRRPALHLNMKLLFCSNFTEKKYLEGLLYLSFLIQFFQNNNVLIPNASTNIKRLNMEMCDLDYADMSHMWSAIGCKQMPSVMYKVGTLTFDNSPIVKVVPSIKSLSTHD